MKTALLALACLLGSPQLFAQNSSVTNSTIYTINLNDLATKQNGFIGDTIIPTTATVSIQLDSTGFSQNYVLRQIILNDPRGRTDVTNSITTRSYSIGNDSALTFTFVIANSNIETDTTSTPQHRDAARWEKEIKIVIYRPSTPVSNTDVKFEQINKKLEELFNEDSEKQPIGYFCLKSDNAVVIDSNSKKSSKILRVGIYTLNGCIAKKGLMVELEDGRVFRNKRAPITIYHLDKRIKDRLYGRNGEYIEVGDILRYNYSGRFYYPDNDSVTLTPLKKCDTLYNYSTVNDLLDVAVYTDLMALLGRRPNGILQTQVTGNFITNTRSLRNEDFILFNFISPYFRLSKFDSKFAQLDSTVLFNDTLHNQLVLNQRSYLQAGFKVNFFRLGLGPNQQILVNVGTDINLTSADSLYDTDVTFVNYYPEVEYRVHGLENFGMDASIKWLRREVAKNSPFVNQEAIWIFNPQVVIYYRPFKNPANKIYLRYANFAEIGKGKHNFGQFQFGFKTNLFKATDK